MKVKDPARDALEVLRSEWFFGDPDARFLPIDPFMIARQLKVDVFMADLAPDVSGALKRSTAHRPQVLVNRLDSRVRQRFTCAHELGHYVRRSALKDLDYEFVDFRSTLASAGVDEEEVYANQFAAELLMPAPLVRQFDYLGERALAAKFNVSTQAMSLRLRNLRLDR